jgi:hypothetical protein
VPDEVKEDAAALAAADDSTDDDSDDTTDDAATTETSEDPTGDTYQPTAEDLERSLEGRDWLRDGQPIDYRGEGYSEGQGDPTWSRRPGVDNPGPVDDGRGGQGEIVEELVGVGMENSQPAPNSDETQQPPGQPPGNVQDPLDDARPVFSESDVTGNTTQDEEPATRVEADINVESRPFDYALGSQYTSAAMDKDPEPVTRGDVGADPEDTGLDAPVQETIGRSTPDNDPSLFLDRTASTADESSPEERTDVEWGSGAESTNGDDSDPTAATVEVVAMEVADPDPEPEDLVIIEVAPIEYVEPAVEERGHIDPDQERYIDDGTADNSTGREAPQPEDLDDAIPDA